MAKKISEPQFITNESGKRISVILDIKFYNSLTEKLEDLQDTLHAERTIAKTHKLHTLEEVEKKLREQGKL